MLSCEIFKELEINSSKILKNDLVQLQRLMEQRHLSERDSKLMIGAQMNMDKKVTNQSDIRHCCFLFLVIGCSRVQAAMAQFVIENSGSLQDTHEQVRKRIHNHL